MRYKTTVRTLPGLLCALLLLLACGCTVGGVDVEQEHASELAGELLDGGAFGQTFVAQYDGLYRIDLYTATYARENSQPVVFTIWPSPPDGAVAPASDALMRLELPAAQVSNSGPTVIAFAPLSGTAGRTLYFSLASPGSRPGDAISVYRDTSDAYAGGRMYVDGRPTDGDMAFIAYTQETFTLADIWRDFTSRAGQDAPFFVGYGALMAWLVAAILVIWFWPAHGLMVDKARNDSAAAVARAESPAKGDL